MEEKPMEYNIRVEWELTSKQTPLLVNQMQLGMGPDSNYGQDSIHYLRLGHVTSPMAPPPEDNVTLHVHEVGHFALTYDRLLELRDMLNQVTDSLERSRHD